MFTHDDFLTFEEIGGSEALAANKDQLIEAVISQYGKQVMNFIYTYIKDWGIAEEIAQDVFITVYNKLDTYEKRSSFKTWLFAIAANKSKDYLRKKTFKRIVSMTPFYSNSIESDVTPENELIQASEEENLARQVLQLPVKYREIILLYYYEDLTLQEISQLLKQKLPTCKSRLQRGRAMLKGKLEREDFR